MKRHHIAALIGAFVLSSCMVGPDYERPAIDVPNAYADGDKSAATEPLRADWWTLYGDAKLNELVASALERNADIRMAVARIEETDANLREANAAFLPEIDFGSTGNRSKSSTVAAVPIPPGIPVYRNDVRMGLSTSFELDFWGHLRRAVESVRAQALASRYGKEVVALTLAGLTTQAYFSLRSLDAQIDVSSNTLKAREESLAFVQARARGGLSSELDLSQAQGARADAAIQLNDLQRQRALAEHQLATLSGRLDLVLPAGDLRKLPTPPLPTPGLPSTLIERRPDIRQAEQILISTNAQIGVAKAAMLPTISLIGSYGGESQSLSQLMSQGGRIWSAGFGLNLPIFDAGRYRARTDAAIAREHQALAGYQKAVETGFREVADAITSVQKTSAAEEDYKIRVDAARKSLRLARLRYEAGYSAYLEVLDSQRTANDAELALLRNRQALLSATVDLMKALGGGWSADQVMLKP